MQNVKMIEDVYRGIELCLDQVEIYPEQTASCKKWRRSRIILRTLLKESKKDVTAHPCRDVFVILTKV